MSAHSPTTHKTPARTDDAKRAKVLRFLHLRREGFGSDVAQRRSGVSRGRAKRWAAELGIDWPY